MARLQRRQVETSSLHYRRDIDGLRAIAVLPVILFHYGVPGFSGGFVGVDVFFVISGFLITSLLIEDIDGGRFSVARFYQRRIARILPALAVLLVITGMAAYVVQLPAETLQTSRAALAAVLSLANVYFWFHSGYFDAASANNPLLHTWSLSVEEQFYILFPILLALTHRVSRRAVVPLLWLVTLASLAAAILLTPRYPEASFYLLPMRAWELSAGALLAFGALPQATTGRRLPFALLGVLMIGGAVAWLDGATGFPGPDALLPVAGTLLVLMCAPGTIVASGLSAQPLVFLGRISYSLYLWHWPIRVFYISVAGPPDGLATIALLVLTLACAALSHRFVEVPFRRAINDGSAGRAIVQGLVSIAIVCVFAAALPEISRATRHLPPEVARLASFADYKATPDFPRQFRPGQCMIADDDAFAGFDRDTCLRRATDRPNYLIVGDSLAAHLWLGFSQAFPEINFQQATASGCRPMLGAGGRQNCAQLMDFVLTKFIPQAAPDAIIIAARWRREDIEPLAATLETLGKSTKKLVIIGPAVEYAQPAPTLLAHDRYWRTSRMGSYRNMDRAALDREMKAALGRWRYVSMQDLICPNGRCVEMAGDIPLQFDYGHFTIAGATEVGRRLRRDGVLR